MEFFSLVTNGEAKAAMNRKRDLIVEELEIDAILILRFLKVSVLHPEKIHFRRKSRPWTTAILICANVYASFNALLHMR